MFEWDRTALSKTCGTVGTWCSNFFSEGEDEGRDISHELDVLDLTAEVANEMYYLKLIAKELGDTSGYGSGQPSSTGLPG